MADSKLDALTATTALAATDLFYVERDPSGTPLDRKITAPNAASELATLGSIPRWQVIFAPTQLSDWSVGSGSWSEPGGGVLEVTSSATPYIYKDFTAAGAQGLAQKVTGEVKVTTGPGSNPIMHAALLHAASGLTTGSAQWRVRGTGNYEIENRANSQVTASSGTLAINTFYPWTAIYNGSYCEFTILGGTISGVYAPQRSAGRFLLAAAESTSQTVQFRNIVVYGLK